MASDICDDESLPPFNIIARTFGSFPRKRIHTMPKPECRYFCSAKIFCTRIEIHRRKLCAFRAFVLIFHAKKVIKTYKKRLFGKNRDKNIGF